MTNIAALPYDGEAIYEASSPLRRAESAGRLVTFANAGFRLVLNYNAPNPANGSLDDHQAYADAAQSAGLRIIWSLKDLWQSLDVAFITAFVQQMKTHPATWGYYIADEAQPTDVSAVQTMSDLVHALDPAHPRLIMGCSVQCDPSQTDPLYSIRPFVNAADVLGIDYYPMKPGWTIDQTASIAAALQLFAQASGKQMTMALQAFSWNDLQHQCDPFPQCAPFPSYEEMLQMRNLVLQNAQPRLTLWYSYPTLLKAADAPSHWQDLTNVINTTSTALLPPPVLTVVPSSAHKGDTVSVSWTTIPSPTYKDWIGVYAAAETNLAHYLDWFYVSGVKTATCAVPTGAVSYSLPSVLIAGTYTFRLLSNDGYSLLAQSSHLVIG